MTSRSFSARLFRRLSGRWLGFAVVLLIGVIGLGWLSLHALRLDSQQRANQHRQQVKQNVRLALWRLDSRLAPYISTLHQKQRRPTSPTDQEQFIQSRFSIIRGNTTQADGRGYQLSERSTEPGWEDDESRIRNEALIRAIEELVPGQKSGLAREPEESNSRPQFAKSKSQKYSNSVQQYGSSNQRQRQSRGDIVQQQVDNSSFADPAPNKSLEHFESELQMVSLWVGDRLAIVRSNIEGLEGLEGVWIDWPALHKSLIAEIDDVLPDATIRPVGEDEIVNPEYTLASLPAVVFPGNSLAVTYAWSPTHTTLLLSWAAFALSALIAGIAVSRLVAISERRAAFVSAVTHELRTPLTTFRLYADLLARDMVTDPADRRSYLETLRREADRLTHLVDNVLRYSRLERTTKPAEPETVTVSLWTQRITPRLRDRLEDADMTLVVNQSGDGPWRTDPPAMEQVLFNLVDNAAKYADAAQDRRVHLDIHVADDEVVFVVADHGDGVPESLRDSMFHPFSKSAQRAAETAAGVGLGLALVKRTVNSLGGSVDYGQNGETGARFQVTLPRR